MLKKSILSKKYIQQYNCINSLKNMKNFKKKVLTFRGRGDMIINVAGSCGRDARKKFERTKTFQKKLKKVLDKQKRT